MVEKLLPLISKEKPMLNRLFSIIPEGFSYVSPERNSMVKDETIFDVESSAYTMDMDKLSHVLDLVSVKEIVQNLMLKANTIRLNFPRVSKVFDVDRKYCKNYECVNRPESSVTKRFNRLCETGPHTKPHTRPHTKPDTSKPKGTPKPQEAAKLKETPTSKDTPKPKDAPKPKDVPKAAGPPKSTVIPKLPEKLKNEENCDPDYGKPVKRKESPNAECGGARKSLRVASKGRINYYGMC